MKELKLVPSPRAARSGALQNTGGFMHTYEWVANPDRLRPFAQDLRTLIYLITKQTVLMDDPFSEFPIAKACQQSHVLSAFYRDSLRERLAGIAVLAPMHQLTKSAGIITDFAVRKEHYDIRSELITHIIAKAKQEGMAVITTQIPAENRVLVRQLLHSQFNFIGGTNLLQLNL